MNPTGYRGNFGLISLFSTSLRSPLPSPLPISLPPIGDVTRFGCGHFRIPISEGRARKQGTARMREWSRSQIGNPGSNAAISFHFRSLWLLPFPRARRRLPVSCALSCWHSALWYCIALRFNCRALCFVNKQLRV